MKNIMKQRTGTLCLPCPSQEYRYQTNDKKSKMKIIMKQTIGTSFPFFFLKSIGDDVDDDHDDDDR